MFRNADEDLSIVSMRSIIDPKIYLIFIFFGLTLLFYSILEMKPVTVNIDDFLGLAYHLSIAYWTGFILIIAVSIRLYLDREIKRDSIYLICLITIGLFLFGISIFTEENARFAWSYHPAGEIKEILKINKIDKISETELGSYRSWPGTHLVSAFTINLANVDTDYLIKYMPIFWVLAVILISYGAGKLFKLPNNQCFITSILVISSFWTINYYYGPQSLAYILYLLFFVSIIFLYRRSDATNVAFMVMVFFTIVVMHMLTSIAIISSFLFSSRVIQFLYKHKIKFMAFFMIVFIGWYVYVATIMFSVGIKDVIRQIADDTLFDTFKGEKYSAGYTLLRQVIHFSRLSYLGIYGILMTIATVLYMKGLTKKENIVYIKICLFWLIGTILLLGLRYGAEIDDRVYILSLLPMALIIVMTFDKRIVSILAILLIALHVPAHYGTESFDMVQTTDLQGSKFIAPQLGTYDSVNYYYSPLIRYYNSQFSNSKGFRRGYYNPDDESLRNSTYIVSSRQMNNYLLYVFGNNNIKNWLQIEGDKLTLLYDNGNYNIYKNVRRN